MATVDEVIAAARSRSGLTDLGADSFHEGLVALLDGAEQAGSFNELGMAVLRDQAIGFLAVRLSVEDWYRRHPEIDDQEILPPLFGLGLPRTGSTALSFLLAEDSRARPLRTWESNSPTPPPEPATYDTDPRVAEASATDLAHRRDGAEVQVDVAELTNRADRVPAAHGAGLPLDDVRRPRRQPALRSLAGRMRHGAGVPVPRARAEAPPVEVPHPTVAAEVAVAHAEHRRAAHGVPRRRGSS